MKYKKFKETLPRKKKVLKAKGRVQMTQNNNQYLAFSI